jgi:CheY-like chemotaxis protein
MRTAFRDPPDWTGPDDRDQLKPGPPYDLLIADDDDGFRETLCEIFTPHFRTWEASSGEEALEIAEATPVDVVLLDMHMERLTGLETVRLLKTMHALTPCILITSDATEQLRREATAAAAYTVLAKPVRRRELVVTVSTALREVYPGAADLFS